MKVIKIIIIILGVIFGLWLIASALMPGHIHLEKSIAINAPAQTVFDQVNNLKNWEKWSYWQEMEPDAQKTYEGPESGVGSKYTWEGKKSGKGTMTIVESTPVESIKTELVFYPEGNAKSTFKFEAGDGATNVIWDFDTDAGFTKRVFMNLMMTKFLGMAYEKGLANLKKVAESAPVKPAVNVEQVTVPRQWVIAIRDTTTLKSEEIGAMFNASFTKIMDFMKSKNLQMQGYPVGIWHKMDAANNFVDVSAGVPVADSVKVGKGMQLIKLGGGNAVKTTNYGAYTKMEGTYNALTEWMTQKGVTPAGDSWEVYITDPMTEKDTTKWVTDIYFPI